MAEYRGCRRHQDGAQARHRCFTDGDHLTVPHLLQFVSECDDENAIFCDQADSGPQHLALIEKMFQTMGMNIAYMTADEQDHSTAFVSHLPHAAAYALANAVQSKEDRRIIFDLASGGFNSTVRLAKSSSTMWHPIFQQNRNYVVESLDVYIKHLQEFRDCLKNEDDEKLHELIVSANKKRGNLEGENPHRVKNEEKNVKI